MTIRYSPPVFTDRWVQAARMDSYNKLNIATTESRKDKLNSVRSFFFNADDSIPISLQQSFYGTI